MLLWFVFFIVILISVGLLLNLGFLVLKNINNLIAQLFVCVVDPNFFF